MHIPLLLTSYWPKQFIAMPDTNMAEMKSGGTMTVVG